MQSFTTPKLPNARDDLIPLLIGGATTSPAHTAVRIAPVYDGPVVHVPDASRAAAIAGKLADPDKRERASVEARDNHERLRELAGRGDTDLSIFSAHDPIEFDRLRGATGAA